MQLASFDLGDPVLDAFGHRLSIQVVTLENLYGLAPERLRVEQGPDAVVVRADGLAWAGQQERSPGRVELRLQRDATGALRARIRARAPHPIRCVKLLLRDLDPAVEIVRADGSQASVGPYGELISYPGTSPAPFLWIRSGERRLGLRAEDRRVRAKRIALWTEHVGDLAGRSVVEAIHEESACAFSPEIESPDWVLTEPDTPEQLERAHLEFAERELGLVPFEERRDAPGWAQRLSLVATLHGMHFTGRVFLRYDEMLAILRFLADRVPGERILAYLPGWEGRYYWQYGDYRPEPRLGGAAGFGALCEGARALGVHVMPMFGANCANVWLPPLAGLDPTAHLKSATRNRFHGNQPDWDLSRAHDTGWQAWLNPGHPEWREALASSIEALAGRYGFDAVFLDTVHAWTNDPDHPVYEGLCELAARLHRSIPGLLLAAEADYDALLPLFALFQRPWWMRPAKWTGRYVRRFGHLCEGEPRGRTGVHEFGVYRPASRGGDAVTLPTLAFQDGTLDSERAAIEAMLAGIRAPGATSR